MEPNESSSKDCDSLQGYDSIENFTKMGFATLMEATKASNSLPQDQSWDLYTAHPAFLGVMEKLGQGTIQLMSRILQHQRMRGNIIRRDTDEKFELLVEANDLIMERIGSNLDEMAGLKKNPVPVLVETSINECAAFKTFSSPGAGSWNKKQGNADQSNKIRLLTAHNIQRPQTTFKDKIDNSNNTLFKPKITDKPNSRKPLALDLDEDGYTHPYDFELENFQPLETQLVTRDPINPLTIDKTPLVHIEDEASLNSLLRDLLNVDVFGIDLEHHSYRTFQGITCLMQISTRKCDYIVDTILLRDKLHVLNEAFTKPEIVKVLHGAEYDVIWLQRDLGLYLVNMFDTHQAAKQLEMARLSLAFLLKHYCNVVADKHFQLADWRIRPLPEELILYARQDTHYLPYIYDKMRNELITMGHGKSNILEGVISKSTDICKKRYIKPKLYPDSHLEMYRKSKRMFDNRQLFALRELYNWRDGLAREEDESTGYILPNHMLLQIAEVLPREMQGILACCNPIPPLVRQNLGLLHQMILKAREQPLIKPVFQEELRTRGSDQKSCTVNVDGPLHCPHDLSQQMEFRDDLPTILGDLSQVPDDKLMTSVIPLSNDLSTTSRYILTPKPKLSVFDSPDNSDDDQPSQELVAKLRRVTFISPYERYKLVRPFIDSIENEKNQTVPKETISKEDEESIARIKEHFNTLTNNTIPETDVLAKVVSSDTIPKVSTNVPECENQKEMDHDQEIDPVVLSLRMKMNNKKRKRKPSVNDSNSKIPNKSMKLAEGKESSNLINENKNQDYNQGKKSKSRNKKNKNKKRDEQRKDNAEFKAFDYGSVDFKKYQGGSQQGPKPDQVNSKFKSKAKNKFSGYKNNKSFTFAGNKGGRKK